MVANYVDGSRSRLSGVITQGKAAINRAVKRQELESTPRIISVSVPDDGPDGRAIEIEELRTMTSTKKAFNSVRLDKNRTPHSLRRTANREMFRAGCSEFSVDLQMGHRRPKQKFTYTGWPRLRAPSEF